MAARAITLHLPGPLFEKIERRAREAHRSIEAELLEVVATAILEQEYGRLRRLPQPRVLNGAPHKDEESPIG
jgi:hypothetical protein